MVAHGSDRAVDALEPGGAWNGYVRAIAGFMSGVGPEKISATDYLAYDDASTGQNWNLPLGYGTLVAASLPSSTSLRLATPVERIDLTADGVAVTTRAGTVRAGAAILTVSTSVLAGDAIRLPSEAEPWREAAAALPLGRNEKIFLEIARNSAFEPDTHAYGNLHDPRSAAYSIRPNGWSVIEAFLGGDGTRIVEEDGPAAGFAYVSAELAALFGNDVAAAVRPLAATSWSRLASIGGRIAAPCRASPRPGHGWPGLSRTGSSSPARRRIHSTSRPHTGPTTAGKGPPTRPWRRLGSGTVLGPQARWPPRGHRRPSSKRIGGQRLGPKQTAPLPKHHRCEG
jgi:monoamine oxidase